MNRYQDIIKYHVKEAANCIDDNWDKAGLHLKVVYHLILINKLDKEIKSIVND